MAAFCNDKKKNCHQPSVHMKKIAERRRRKEEKEIRRRQIAEKRYQKGQRLRA